MRGLGHFLDSGKDDAAPGLRVRWGGLEGGTDVAIGEGARLGAAIGYEGGNLSDTLGGRASEQIFRASLYGSQTFGAVGLSAAFTYAHGWDDTSRASGFGPSAATRSVNEWTGAVQAAAPLESSGVSITPAAGVLISGVSGGAFSETNPLSAAFAVTGTDQSRTLVSPYAVIGVSHAFTSGDGMVVAPSMQVGYRYDAAAQGGRVTLVAPDGTVFDNIQFERNRNSALVGAGFTATQGRWTGFVKYRASLSSNWTDQAVEAGFRLGF
jgi:outer membrane autotransporter protein